MLPFDLLEATAMVEGFHSGMTQSELLALRLRQLEKRPSDLQKAATLLTDMRLKSKAQFERRYYRKLFTNTHEPGTLVLVRNSSIEQSLDRKSKPRYLGPVEVVKRSTSGSYIVKELNGALWLHKVAAGRLIPYVLRDDQRLQELKQSSGVTEDFLPLDNPIDDPDEDDSD